MKKKAYNRGTGMLTALRKGSLWVWLSALIWGLGNLIRRQFVKGTLFLAAEAGVVLFTIQSGLYNLDKLTTLGTVAQQKVWNDEKSIFEYASACKPEYIDLKSRLSQIKGKKNDQFGKVDYMSEAAVKALMEAPDVSTTAGLTDQFMMVMLYDTGARIQEILSLRLCDLKIDKTPTAIIHGKGGKTRIVPLMPETVKHLKKYLSVLHPDEHMHSESYLFFTRHKGQKVQMCDDKRRLFFTSVKYGRRFFNSV